MNVNYMRLFSTIIKIIMHFPVWCISVFTIVKIRISNMRFFKNTSNVQFKKNIHYLIKYILKNWFKNETNK